MRESLSAASDGEAFALTLRQVDDHLAACVPCRQWQCLAVDVTRRARIGDRLPEAGLTQRIVRAADDDVRRRRSRRQWAVVAALVGVSGVVQLAVSLPLLALHGRSWWGGWVVLAEGLVAATFFLGATVLLWHTRQATEPVGLLHAADRRDIDSDDAEQVA